MKISELVKQGLAEVADDGTTLVKVSPDVSGKIEIDEGIKVIDHFAFATCKDVTEVVISDTVEEIRHGAFLCCTGLNEIDVPDSVKTIGAGAFSHCGDVDRIIIPDGVKIEPDAYEGTNLGMQITRENENTLKREEVSEKAEISLNDYSHIHNETSEEKVSDLKLEHDKDDDKTKNDDVEFDL